VPGSLHTVANNFNGDSVIQGPEFVQPPGGELGIIYPGSGGVYGVFRSPTPEAWYDFSLDITGAPTNGSPPILPTSIGQYPLSQNPLGHRTYGQDLGNCTGNGAFPLDWCYGALGFGVATDLQAVLSPQGFTISDAVQSPRDGYFFISACRASFCGLYEGQIDNAGGLVSNTVTMLAQTQQAATNIAAARHPVTGTTVLFSEDGSTLIDVWEQPASGGALKLIANVPTPTPSHHYDTRTDTTQVVLHYYGPQKGVGGSYTIPVTASGSTLVAGASKLISVFNNGSDLIFLPAANQWAFYSYSPFECCWVTP
jgi:hypothetical protein